MMLKARQVSLRKAALSAAVCSLAGLTLLGAVGASSAAAAGSSTWTPAAVSATTNGQVTYNVFNVPKKLPKITLGFIQLDLTNPYFATWNSAMAEAASFYGVKYVYGDEDDNDANILNDFNTLKLEGLSVIGAQHSTQPLLQAAQSANIPLLGLDSTAIPGLKTMGIPNTQAGRESGRVLVPTLKQDLNTTWKHKQVYYIGLSSAGCAPCQQRVEGALSVLKTVVKLPASHVKIFEDASATQTQTDVGAYFTAHPGANARFIIVGLNDEWAVAAMQAAVTAHRTADAIGDTAGCDNVGLAALKNSKYKGMNLGCVNYNPYSEAWNWVEGAIATALHKSYKPYQVTGFIKYGQ